jgi:hypothetical protein
MHPIGEARAPFEQAHRALNDVLHDVRNGHADTTLGALTRAIELLRF